MNKSYMKIYGESVFDILYLGFVFYTAFLLAQTENSMAQLYFVAATLTLGIGDTLHLVPRVYALWSGGLEKHSRILGVGRLTTSISMTVFYVLLWHGLMERYPQVNIQWLSIIIYSLAVLRIILCLFPQNEWFDVATDARWSTIRNIPFFILGLIILLVFFRYATIIEHGRSMFFAIFLSFYFYAPVVLFVHRHRWLGSLMIPKTCAYIWLISMF